MIVGGVMTHLIPFSMLVDTRRDSCKEDESVDDEVLGINITSPENRQLSRSDDNEPGYEHETGKENEPSNDGEGIDLTFLDEGRSRLSLVDSSSKADMNKKHERPLETRTRAILKKIIHAITKSIFYQDPWLTVLMLVVGLVGMIDGGWHAFFIPRAVSRGYTDFKSTHPCIFRRRRLFPWSLHQWCPSQY